MAPSAASLEEDEDDYMSMAIPEPQAQEKETSIQKRARKQREAELKGRAKSKAEREKEEREAREAALATSMDTSNKGFKMMTKLGYKPGGTLGQSESARTEPIELSLKEGRGGIGMDSEKKRKFREQIEHEAKRVKAEEGDYRERLRQEREEKRMEGQSFGAMKVAEKLDTESEEEARAEHDKALHVETKEPTHSDTQTKKPLKSVNVLWRQLVRHRIEKERERRIRNELQQSLSRNPAYDDPDEDEEDKRATGQVDKAAIAETELEEEDPELDEFIDLPIAERLERLVHYLRDTYQYCFWCKFQYPDNAMDGCPGTTEDEHG